jgi:hypothetical protein
MTALEYELIKTHAQAGYGILKEIEFPWPIAHMVYQHHERLDGSGYPRGLKRLRDPDRRKNPCSGRHSRGDGLTPPVSARPRDREGS